MKILLVEDDESVRSIMTKFLIEEDHSVKSASNGRVALMMLRDLIPDMVLTDIKMPEMSGIDFLEQAREKYNIPFVMMTGYADTDIAVRALKAGAWYFILKPVNFFELKSIIDRVAGYRRLENELAREKARQLDLFSLEDFSAMLRGISQELIVPIENIRSDLESFSRALIGLRSDSTTAREMPLQEFRRRLDGSLACLTSLLDPIEDAVHSVVNVAQTLSVLRRNIRAVHWSEVVLDAAVKDAMRLVETGEKTETNLEIDSSITVLADRESLVLLLGRILRALLRNTCLCLSMQLKISAQQLESEVLITITITREEPGNQKEFGNGIPGEEIAAGNEAFEFMALRGAASAIGGHLSHNHPAPESMEYVLRLLPAVENSGMESDPKAQISGVGA